MVKFTDDTYYCLRDDTTITSSSDKKEVVCIKGLLNKEIVSGEKVVDLVYKFDEKSHWEYMKSESIANI